MNPSDKIVLITSGQPSLNPRLVKEADALTASGYDVTLIYQYRNSWGTVLDDQMLANKKWTVIRVGGHPINDRLTYWKSRLIHKIGQFLALKITLNHSFAEMAIGRCTFALINVAEKIPAQIYIAHNLAALPAAVEAAKKNKAKCGFDAEDFHRNEVSDDPNSFEVKLNTYLEDKYFKQLNYLSTASPLIAAEYKKLYPGLNPITILNTFPKQHVKAKESINPNGIKLFWFSQTIGLERGIEDVILAMGSFANGAIELHLLGDHDLNTKAYFNSLAKAQQLNNVIHYYQPIAESEIFNFAQQFDIGLATELGTPKNRDICLTNKIFTYVQSGLAIIASNTKSQQLLLNKFPNMGYCYEKENIKSLVTALQTYVDNHELLKMNQDQAKEYGTNTLNWEYEQQKFLSILNQILI